ncbi:unnamed protein product [Candidula unifasciata]|uniref:Mitochondrial ribosomal protein S28 n=1 Tax=Candidula unifasciata TaxID=100452 RepID=A0A8S3YI39_9EUPU|nr:unnamed protein product [Candidula unifasciata]
MTARKFTLSICSSRLYSSSKEGAGSTGSVDSKEETNKQRDNVSDASDSREGDANINNPTTNNTEGPSEVSPTERAVDKFFKVVEKVKQFESRADTFSNKSDATAEKTGEGIKQKDAVTGTENESFATMLRKSKFVSLGEFSGRLVEGTIFEVMEDDLYIDFGGKFHCVCPRPKRNPDHYHRGRKVLVSLQAMEMSSSFLGSDKHVTLLEADGTLIGMAPSYGSERTSTARQE